MSNPGATKVIGVFFSDIGDSLEEKPANTQKCNQSNVVQFYYSFINKLENKKRKFGGSV